MPLGWAAPWGKLGAAGRHHLAHHCADVAACFEAICALPVVRARLERAAERDRKFSSLGIARLCALVFLHDCGKLHPGFQAKAWPLGIWHGFVGHLVAGAALFSANETEAIARALNAEALTAWGVDANLLYAVLAHHGRPFGFDDQGKHRWRKVEAIGYDPLASAQEMGRAMRLWFEPAFAKGSEPLPNAPDFQHLLCGLIMLADWLGSTEEIFSYVAEFDPDYWDKPGKRPERRYDISGWTQSDCARSSKGESISRR
jgi:CRISPR-associated endonuclease/helicase Cas3